MNSRDRESIKGAREVEREINLDRGGGASAPSFITARYSGTEFTNEIQPAPSLSPIFPRINDSRATRGCFSSSPPRLSLEFLRDIDPVCRYNSISVKRRNELRNEFYILPFLKSKPRSRLLNERNSRRRNRNNSETKLRLDEHYRERE